MSFSLNQRLSIFKAKTGPEAKEQSVLDFSRVLIPRNFVLRF